MSRSVVSVSCPGHISGFFRPVITGEALSSGSTGAGIVIDPGVIATVSPAPDTSVSIWLKQPGTAGPVLQASSSQILMTLLSDLGVTAQVSTLCSLPLSSGYGLSAAALLATTHAVNLLFDLGLSDSACSALAHRVEVESRTGLGDVAACQGGGWVYRGKPGVDSDILRFFDDRTVTALTLGPLKTTTVLSSPAMMRRVEQAYPSAVPRDLEEFFALSRTFAESSGLISDEIRKVLIACDANDIPASMTMLGNGVFALGDAAEPVLSRFGHAFSLQIASDGPEILENVK